MLKQLAAIKQQTIQCMMANVEPNMFKIMEEPFLFPSLLLPLSYKNSPFKSCNAFALTIMLQKSMAGGDCLSSSTLAQLSASSIKSVFPLSVLTETKFDTINKYA